MNSMLNYLRKCQTVFQRDCTILHARQQCTGFKFLHIFATLVIIYLAILVGVAHVIFNDLENVTGGLLDLKKRSHGL